MSNKTHKISDLSHVEGLSEDNVDLLRSFNLEGVDEGVDPAGWPTLTLYGSEEDIKKYLKESYFEGDEDSFLYTSQYIEKA